MRVLLILLTLLCGSGAMMAQTPAGVPGGVPSPVPAAAAPLPVLDAAHQATAEQVREYFGLIHLDNALKSMTTNVVRSSRASSASFIPADFWDDMTQTFNQFDIVSEYVPIYQKVFSKDDMVAILAFYRSEAGKHMIAAEPTLRSESQQHFQELARKLGQEVEARHKDEIMAAKKKYDDSHSPAGTTLAPSTTPPAATTLPASATPPAATPPKQ